MFCRLIIVQFGTRRLALIICNSATYPINGTAINKTIKVIILAILLNIFHYFAVSPTKSITPMELK